MSVSSNGCIFEQTFITVRPLFYLTLLDLDEDFPGVPVPSFAFFCVQPPILTLSPCPPQNLAFVPRFP